MPAQAPNWPIVNASEILMKYGFLPTVARPCPRLQNGAERRQALVRNAAPGGPPCGRADPWIARDHRPMTLAGAPLGAPPRHFWRSFHFAAAPGRASGNRHLRRPVQRAPRRAVVVPPGSLPGAARVQAYEACPQGPPLAPSAERLRKTPLSERGDGDYSFIPEKVKIFPRYLVSQIRELVACSPDFANAQSGLLLLQ
jgi:hypothetical protein